MTPRKKRSIALQAGLVISAVFYGVVLACDMGSLRVGALWGVLGMMLLASAEMLWSLINAIFLFCCRRGECASGGDSKNAEGEQACLACGAMIPPVAVNCPSCGWTWNPEEIKKPNKS
jgi:hypothetical protein